MKRLQPYLSPLVAFITNLIALGYRIIRQIILPSRGRKGNLLSSLFVLFTSLTEQVIGFAETIARIPRRFRTPAALDRAWIYSRRHLRRAMLVAVWALFILSSLEWMGREQATAAAPVVEQQATAPPITIEQQATSATNKAATTIASAHESTPLLPAGQPPTTPRWLLLRTLRV